MERCAEGSIEQSDDSASVLSSRSARPRRDVTDSRDSRDSRASIESRDAREPTRAPSTDRATAFAPRLDLPRLERTSLRDTPRDSSRVGRGDSRSDTESRSRPRPFARPSRGGSRLSDIDEGSGASHGASHGASQAASRGGGRGYESDAYVTRPERVDPHAGMTRLQSERTLLVEQIDRLNANMRSERELFESRFVRAQRAHEADTARLEKRIADLTFELSAMSEIKTAFDRMQIEHANIAATLNSAHDQAKLELVQQHYREIQELRKSVEEEKDALKEKQRTVDQIKANELAVSIGRNKIIETQREQIAKLSQQLEEAQTAKKNVEIERANAVFALSSQVATLSMRIKELEAGNSVERGRMAKTLESTGQTLERSFKSSTSAALEMQEQLWKGKLDTARAECTQAMAELKKQTDDEKDARAKQLAASEQIVTDLRRRITELEKELSIRAATISSKNSDLTETLAGIERSHISHQAQIRQMATNFSTERDSLIASNSALNTELLNQRNQFERAREELVASVSKMRDTAEADRITFRRTLEESLNRLNSLQSRIDSLEKENAGLRSGRETTDDYMRVIEKQRLTEAQAMEKARELQARIDDLEARLKVETSTTSQLTADMTQARDVINTLSQDKETALLAAKQAREEAEQIRNKIQANEADRAQFMGEREAIFKMHQALQAKASDLEHKQAISVEHVRELEKDRSSLQERNSVLSNSLGAKDVALGEASTRIQLLQDQILKRTQEGLHLENARESLQSKKEELTQTTELLRKTQLALEGEKLRVSEELYRAVATTIRATFGTTRGLAVIAIPALSTVATTIGGAAFGTPPITRTAASAIITRSATRSIVTSTAAWASVSRPSRWAAFAP